MKKLLITILSILVFVSVMADEGLRRNNIAARDTLKADLYFKWRGEIVNFQNIIDSLVVLQKDSINVFVTPKALMDSILASAGGHAPVTFDAVALNNGFSLTDQKITFDSAAYMFKSDFAMDDTMVINAKNLDGHPLSDTPYGLTWVESDSATTQKHIYNKIESLEGSVLSITLPNATSVAGRVSAAVSGINYPAGWTITADGLNLEITHSMGRWVTGVTVWAKTTGTQRQQLFNTAAFNGITCLSDNVLKIYSLSTIAKDIVIYITLQ